MKCSLHLNLVYKNYMTASSTVQLVSQYNIFLRELCSENDNEIQRQRKFHKHLFKRQDYYQLVKESLGVGYKGQRNDLFICGEYLAYIINFQPQFEQHLSQQVKIYIEAVVNKYFYHQQAKRLFVMLSQGEEIYLLQQIKHKIDDMTSVTCIEQIQIFINILAKKINWELQKSEIIRKRYNGPFHKFIDQLIAFLCDKSYAKNQEIMQEMIQLMTLVFKYLKKEIVSYKAMINDLMEEWLKRTIFKSQLKVELFKILATWIESLGYQKANLLYDFLNCHMQFIKDIHYLRLLAVFVEKIDPSHINQKQIIKILKELIDSTFQLPNSSHFQSYESKSLTIDLIIKISSLFTCDQSKYLSQHLKKANNDSHKSLMTSLMYVFDRSLSVQTMKTIQQHKLKYLQSAKPNQHLCYSVLNQYCQQHLQFEQFIINPEMMDDFLWQFLMIRTTVSINFNAICEINKVQHLVVNLIKFAILDIYSCQCLQIIEKILSNNQLYALHFLKTLSFSTIIEQVKPILIKSIMNSQNGDHLVSMFQNLTKILTTIAKSYQIEEALKLQLVESILRFSNELPDRFIGKNLIKYQTQLLLVVTPLEFTSISQSQFKACIEELILFIRRYSTVTSFELYLQMMRRGIYEKHLHNILMASSEQIGQFVERSNKLQMAQNLQDIYKINYYILSNSPFNQDVLTNCWKILINNDTFHYTQLCFYIIDLFRYFSIYFYNNGNEQVMYIRFQLQNAQRVLSHIDTSIQNIICLRKIEEFLCCKLALMTYLQQIHQRYWEIGSSLCDQVVAVHRYLLRAYDSMKDTTFYLSCFQQDKFSIKQYWCNTQALILLIIPSIVTKERNQNVPFLIGKLLELDQRFQWLKNIIPSNCRQQVEQFAICFNCQINELMLITDKRIGSQG